MSADEARGPEVTDEDHLSSGNEEIIASHCNTDNTEENEFDEMMGALQDILLDPEFVQLQASFSDQYADQFEDTDENKLEYTELFERYTTNIEDFLEQQMQLKLDSFSMERLCELLPDHEDEVPGDVMDILMQCSDFQEFKNFMLAHKQNAQVGF